MKILLIDLSAIYWAAWHSSANEAVSYAQSRTLAGVAKAIQLAGADHVAICCDAGRSWRKDVAESYKAHRPEKDHAALDELRNVEERLEKDGHLLWKFVAFEADDVIATAVEKAGPADVVIATADKDLLQLVSERVAVLSTRTWETINEAEVVDKFKVIPSQIADYLALVGDASDGIKGAPGIGPVKASALIGEFGSLKAIFNAVHTAPDSMPAAVVKSLRENGDTVDLARKLVTLRTDVPLHFLQILEEREQKPLLPEDPPADTPQVAETSLVPVADAFAVQQVGAAFDRQLEPVTLAAAYRLARGMYESRLYQRFPNAEAIFAVMIRGREVGLPALTALDCFHVVEGRPTPSAHLIIELAQRHPDCEYLECTESTETQATWETKRKGRPVRTLTYAIEQAKAAGLLVVREGRQQGNWHKRPAEMLRKTAGVQLARMVYPGASLGLYAVEELPE